MSLPLSKRWNRVMLVFLSLGTAFLLLGMVWGFITGDVLGTGDVVPFILQNALLSIVLLLTGASLLLAVAPIVLPRLLTFFAAPSFPAPERAVITRRCREIDRMMAEATPSSYKNAVVTMDSLLDYALKTLRYQGSLADKLKAAQKRFSDIDRVWQAHRFRNRVVHEIDLRACSRSRK